MDITFEEMLYEINERKKDEALQLFSTRTEWTKYKEYKIIYLDNIPVIVPIDETTIHRYNPFDFYPQILLDFVDLTTNIHQISVDYKQDKKYDIKTFLTMVAKKALKFNNKYGLFNYEYGLFTNHIYKDGKIDNTAKYLSRKHNDFDNVMEYIDKFEQYSFNFYVLNKYLSENYSLSDNVSENTDITWGQLLNIFYADNIGVGVDFSTGHPQFCWTYDSLFKALDIMMVTTFVIDKNIIRFCELDTCRKPFILTRKDRKYCSDNCSNTARQRLWRFNEKKK